MVADNTTQALACACPDGIVLRAPSAPSLQETAQSTPPFADDQILLQLLLCSGHLSAGDIGVIVLNSRVRNKTIEQSLADSGAVTTALCSEAHNVFGLYKEGFLTFVQATKCLSHVMPAGEYPVARSVEEHFEPAPSETINMSTVVQNQETIHEETRSSAQRPLLKCTENTKVRNCSCRHT